MKGLKPILLVEDDQMDFMQLDRALHEMKIVNPLIHKKCGAEALQYLTDDNNDRPCLIISDLNMPGMSGTEFIRIAKSNGILANIPVVVLTNLLIVKSLLMLSKLLICRGT
jgi:CheY-like chemotaxis protein